jgi:hypothetical protein
MCFWFSCDALLVELDTQSVSGGGEYKEDVDV